MAQLLFNRTWLLASILLLTACRTATNYDDPALRMGLEPAPLGAAIPDDSLRAVSFNVRMGEDIEGAIQLLRSHEDLRNPDLLLLQEMDEDGVRRVARELRMGYVYYPAVRSKKTDRDFGNAVLSPWPILDQDVMILPHRALFSRMQRTATAATVDIEGRPVRIYSTHLGTQVEIGDHFRDDQLEQILEDAVPFPLAVVGGDMNTGRVGHFARRNGYSWPTKEGPWTAKLGRWDHLFFRGFGPSDQMRSGTLEDVGDVSDHVPIWVVVPLSR